MSFRLKPRAVRWDANGMNRFLLFAHDRERNCTMLIYEKAFPRPGEPTTWGNAAIKWNPNDQFDGIGGRDTNNRFEFEGPPVP